MKKIHRRILLCVEILILCLAIGGCTKNTSEVLVVLNSQLDVSYKNFQDTAKEWADEKNISIQLVAPKTASVYEQQNILEHSIKEHTWDYIVIEPLGEVEMYPILDYAKQQGSIIVSIQGSEQLGADYKVHPCNYEELGISMMDTLAQAMGNTGSYVTMVPNKESSNILEEEISAVTRQKNNYQQMMATSRMQIGDNIKSSYHTVKSLYEAYEMEGILFFSHVEGLGISQWKESTDKNTIVVGAGHLEVMQEALNAGNVDVLYYWNRSNLLEAALEVGYQAVNKKIDGKTQIITTDIKGYKTLRISKNGICYGDAIETATGG